MWFFNWFFQWLLTRGMPLTKLSEAPLLAAPSLCFCGVLGIPTNKKRNKFIWPNTLIIYIKRYRGYRIYLISLILTKWVDHQISHTWSKVLVSHRLLRIKQVSDLSTGLGILGPVGSPLAGELLPYFWFSRCIAQGTNWQIDSLAGSYEWYTEVYRSDLSSQANA